LRTNSIKGWSNILNKVEDCVKIALDETKSEKVDFIGHSSGGVMLRLYLAEDSFNGKSYSGKTYTSNLITLGSPHQALRSTSLRKFVDQTYPGNFFSNVNYVSVGGEVDINSSETKLITKILAKNSYKAISGDKDAIGDGLVPLSSSLLNNSQKIILKSTAHSALFGNNWYGTHSRIDSWYKQINWI